MHRKLAALVALFLAAVAGRAQAGTLIDTYTHALPPNTWLPVSHRPIVFLGTACDGSACPPSTLVTYPHESAAATQAGVPGAISSLRRTGLIRANISGPLDQGTLRIDATSGGSMILENVGGAGLVLLQIWGGLDHPLDLDLLGDNSDRFEIDILAGPVGPDAIRGAVSMSSSSAAGAATRGFLADGPGLVSVPYAGFMNLDPMVHDIDSIELIFYIAPGPSDPLVIGEIRTASEPLPAQHGTWGRIKGSYRR